MRQVVTVPMEGVVFAGWMGTEGKLTGGLVPQAHPPARQCNWYPPEGNAMGTLQKAIQWAPPTAGKLTGGLVPEAQWPPRLCDWHPPACIELA